MTDAPVKAQPQPMLVGGTLLAIVPQSFEEIQRVANTVIAGGLAPASLLTRPRDDSERAIVAQQNIAAENRAAQDRRFDRTESTHSKHMEKMGATIERAITSMESATRVLEKVADKNSGGGGGP